MKEKKSDNVQRFALRFLKSICPDHLYEEIEGDLIQRYERDIKRIGERRAKRKLLWSAARFFRPGILLRNDLSINLIQTYMLANYFKVALRVMFRNKTFSAINISGLALGITGALLLFLWIEREFTYDQFHSYKDRLYVAWNRSTVNGQISCWSTTPRVLAPALKDEYAAVEGAVSFAAWGGSQLFTVGEKRLLKTSGVYTDPAFLTMFSFPLLKGDQNKALDGSNSIVLTENFARELFGEREPFGETVTVGESGYSFEFTVTGVLKDLPPNTDVHFDYLIPFQFLESIGEKDTFWGNNSVSTYVKLREGTELSDFNNEIKDIEKKHYADGQHIEIFLYPLTKMRLYSRFENGVPVGGRIEIIRMLGILGICLIVIACINFVNLSTARAQRRSKEVAVRKVTGAHRYSLVSQFLCESILLAFGAGVISLIATYLALPLFNDLVQQQLVLDFGNITFWIAALIFIVVIGLLAGGYPAFYLSSFRPIRILKGMRVSTANRSILRTMLVVFQFGFAITMIVSAIVIRKQINFVQNREAGYAKDNLIYLPLTGDLNKNFLSFKNDVLESGVALSVTRTSAPMTEQWSGTTEMKWRGKDPMDKTDIERFYMDENISVTAGLTIIQGRDIDLSHFPSDSSAVLLNKTAAGKMGFDNPVGETIVDNGREWHVIGVVKDFILLSPFQKVEPIVLFSGVGLNRAFNVAYLKLSQANSTRQHLSILSSLSSKYNPDYPFEYHFADVEYRRKFSNMEATLKITTVFTSIAIFIACLGLLGLSTYMTETRIKEIGIRKVLGGSTLGITRLLSVSALRPIFIAIVVFSPQAWFAMNWWLQSFAYRIPLDIWIFFASSLAILLIAVITIGVQTVRAANSNPVKSLRSE